ncbi:Heat shock 70 kDa protein 12B [Apiospora kogelbergensis]|uniref:Heat shock 70 kDa protein 12B n=1 Tax=Apiospora kogelbergensis TaxID=1337665 RepID=UPI00312CE1AF
MEGLAPYSVLSGAGDGYVDRGTGSLSVSDDTLVIGIDFGTTNSGAAWATLEDIKEGQVYPVTRWPGCNREEAKAPTELFYEDDKLLWGFEVPNDADPVRWFKLLLLKEEDLDPDTRVSEPLLRARKMLKENGKSETDLIADYLHKLWQHVLAVMAQDRGKTIVDELRFHVVITVPAIWKGYARQGMKKAAKQSGILDHRAAGQTTLSFVPEPEAAALATLSEPGRKVQPNDVFVVCDAGGGTVFVQDLISYRVESIEPLQLAEAVEGTGGLCGGIFVDEVFERLCKSRLGRKWDKLSKAGINEVMKREWENGIKPQFKLQGRSKRYIASIPAEAFVGSSNNDSSREPIIRHGRIQFREEDIEKAFAGVFADINKLVDGQIRKSRQAGMRVSGIILVGGLGCSPRLYEHLKRRYQKDNINLVQSSGIKPRSAICRGAVWKGFLDGIEAPQSLARSMPVAITSTIARASYGITFRADFDENTHLREDKTWDEYELRWKANNQITWFLKKGENVSKKNQVRYSYYEIHKTDFGGVMKVDLQTSEAEQPAPRKTPSVNKLCDIVSILDVPFQALPNWTNDKGESFKKLSYDVEMVPSGATLEFNIYIDGKRQKSKDITITF